MNRLQAQVTLWRIVTVRRKSDWLVGSSVLAVVLLLFELGEPFVLPDAHFTARPWSISSKTSLSSAFVDSDNDKADPNAFSIVADQKQKQIELGRETFQRYYDFPLDDWQLQAGGAIIQGANVIVSSPTGSGKTVVGEMALLYAYHHNPQQSEAPSSGIYTTPLKALSNQKYTELTNMFGRADVGLSTGDFSINKGARITVMTTEVYRNIAWRSSTPTDNNELIDNAVVVLDEFHYMGHPERGGVWEESIITSPAHTQIVGLSATLSNAPALAAWMESVTNRTAVLIEVPASQRPVPLRYLFATKEGLFPLFRDPDAGPGAPKGLLGYRGDGVSDTSPSEIVKNGKKSGFGRASSPKKADVEKLPRGLEPSPALRAAATKRLQRVQRNLERQKQQWRAEDDSDNEWDSNGKRRNVYRPPRLFSPRQERKETERLLRNEMRRAVPSFHALVMRLQQKNLLPAIFFVFSRAGCDEASRALYHFMNGSTGSDRLFDDEEMVPKPNKSERKTRQRSRKRGELFEDEDGRSFRPGSNFVTEDVLSSMFDNKGPLLKDDDFDEQSPLSAQNWKYYASSGLLGYDQIREVASRISVFNKENEEIAFEDEVIEQYLFGVGSHHAGMLPAHKSFVESLYRNQLMLVVFATETIAAGINLPCRTTVICSMAKRGDGSSMNLLDTSNLLQMAGRAGRRGMDVSGTCVIRATPFESHDDAVKILTDPIKPITSQFSPSYALAVNLVARGEGKLDVARQLVSKSFAMWEKQQMESSLAAGVEKHGESVSEVFQASAQERFVKELIDTLQVQVDKGSAKLNVARLQGLLAILGDQELLKKASKSFAGTEKMLELEETTRQYLEKELELMKIREEEQDWDLLRDVLGEDVQSLIKRISTQNLRVSKTQKEIHKHPFSAIADIANQIMSESTPQATVLRSALSGARAGSTDGSDVWIPLTPRELADFAKSSIVIRRKMRKLMKGSPNLDVQALIEQADKADNSWDDMLSIAKTLVDYGCLSPIGGLIDDMDIENETFNVTQAGSNVGMLMFENSLWALVAMGGTWDVSGASNRLDQFRDAMDSFDEENSYDRSYLASGSASREEACELVELLRSLEPAELAGYVACLVADSSRGGGPSVVELFQRLTPLQQRVIQKSLLVMERLTEVQKQNSVDDNTRNCPLDISNCEVVTAWASGCTWNEALQISGSAPGDLVRILSRVLDAVRQFSKLPFTPIKAPKSNLDGKLDPTPLGLHPDIRRLSRQAAGLINRYPVKDTFAFETGDDSEFDEDIEESSSGILSNTSATSQ